MVTRAGVDQGAHKAVSCVMQACHNTRVMSWGKVSKLFDHADRNVVVLHDASEDINTVTVGVYDSAQPGINSDLTVSLISFS